ncbi:hypothetical protein [Candidatus Enterococcus lemimoniae]|uniref:Uncharacterized protein n=1 Tax=Candidatus Enterococcus lemimoniae TaxID=1834167 RepID=A0ABZ2T3P7_9ENTE|nr:hypothetical protein [Enterococcus sp. 12C11_DIV0727]OTO68743.1 hypothetical protein A5866_000941 [Enterococcus sp. 12C11_DIV0727]
MKEYIYKKYSAVIEQESDAAKVIEVIKKRDVSIKYPTNTSMTKINLCHAKEKLTSMSSPISYLITRY